tara:strand:+ start:1400 stop:1726 length:327 start_codon:yes stop_codon:yes gene_type:complete
MINWNYLRENYPDALREYMQKSWSIEDFWRSYDVYVNCRLIEEETGCELWDWKISSKLVIYTSLCYKSIIKDGKKISVYTFDDIMEKKIGQIFKLVDDQIKNENYLKN